MWTDVTGCSRRKPWQLARELLLRSKSPLMGHSLGFAGLSSLPHDILLIGYRISTCLPLHQAAAPLGWGLDGHFLFLRVPRPTLSLV